MENLRDVTIEASDADGRAAIVTALEPYLAGSGIDLVAAIDGLAPYEEELVAWTAQSPQNAQRFLEDPVAALREAELGVPEATIDTLQAGSQLLAPALGAHPLSAPEMHPPRAAPVASSPPSTAAVSLQTNGWDLVAAATQQTIQTLIAQAFAEGLIPNPIEQTIEVLHETITMIVHVGAPKLDLNPSEARGQSGLVGITLPIQSGTIVFPNHRESIPPGTFEVVTNLAYVHIDAQHSGSIERLSLDFTGPSAVYNVIIDDPVFDPDTTLLMEAAFAKYFKSLLPGTVHLADVNVPAVAAPFAPTGEITFAIQVQSNSAQNVLLLLMTTSGGTTPSGPGARDFSSRPSLVPAGQPSALYISNRLLIQGITVPAVAGSLQVQTASFTVTGNATTPYAAEFHGTKSIPGEDDPELTGLVLSVNAKGQVQGYFHAHAHPALNVSAIFWVEVVGNVFVTPNLDVTHQTISFATTADKGEASLHVSAAGWVLVAAAIIAVYGTVGPFFTAVLAAAIPVLLTHLKFPITLPISLTTALSNAIGSFTWPLQQNYQLSAIQLPGDLVLVGTPLL